VRGLPHVTASYGIEGLTADHLAAFKQHSVKRVLIAYDRDEAGDRAAEKLAKQLLAEGLDCYRIQFPKAWMRTSTVEGDTSSEIAGTGDPQGAWLGRGDAKPIHTAVSARRVAPGTLGCI